MFTNYKQWRNRVGAQANRQRPTCEARTRPGHRGIIGPPGCVVRKRESDNGQQIREVNRRGETIHTRDTITLRQNQGNLFRDDAWLRIRNPSNNRSRRVLFQVDTGASNTNISDAVVQYLGLNTHPPPGVQASTTTIASGQVVPTRQAQLPLTWILRGKAKTRNVTVEWIPNMGGGSNLLGLSSLRAFRVKLV
jgi:hypothetical protein